MNTNQFDDNNHDVSFNSDWRNMPLPKAIPPHMWDHNMIVNADLAEYLLWKYQNTKCTLHGMTILPDAAEVFLTRRNNIRNEDRKHTRSLAHEMTQGRFEYIGDAVRFDTEGNMLDSHHRLDASDISQRPIVSDIIFGLPPHTKRLIDTGQKKRGADMVLRTLGVSNYSTASTICRDALSCIETGSFSRNIQRIPESRIEAFYHANSEAINTATKLALKIKDIFKPSDIGSLIFFLIRARNRRWITKLVGMLDTGRIGEEHTNAMRAFAHRAWRHRGGGEEKMPCDMIRWALLTVINIEKNGKRINGKKALETKNVQLDNHLNGRWPEEIVQTV